MSVPTLMNMAPAPARPPPDAFHAAFFSVSASGSLPASAGCTHRHKHKGSARSSGNSACGSQRHAQALARPYRRRQNERLLDAMDAVQPEHHGFREAAMQQGAKTSCAAAAAAVTTSDGALVAIKGTPVSCVSSAENPVERSAVETRRKSKEDHAPRKELAVLAQTLRHFKPPPGWGAAIVAPRAPTSSRHTSHTKRTQPERDVRHRYARALCTGSAQQLHTVTRYVSHNERRTRGGRTAPAPLAGAWAAATSGTSSVLAVLALTHLTVHAPHSALAHRATAARRAHHTDSTVAPSGAHPPATAVVTLHPSRTADGSRSHPRPSITMGRRPAPLASALRARVGENVAGGRAKRSSTTAAARYRARGRARR